MKLGTHSLPVFTRRVGHQVLTRAVFTGVQNGTRVMGVATVERWQRARPTVSGLELFLKRRSQREIYKLSSIDRLLVRQFGKLILRKHH